MPTPKAPTSMQRVTLELVGAGLRHSEIAMALRLSPRAVESRLYRARLRMKVVAPSRRRPHVSQLSACPGAT